MAKPILMPQIGENIETGKIIEWLVKVGDSVKAGDIIVVVESEKATFEVEAYEPGVIQEILYSDGDEAAVLKPIAYLAEAGEEIGDSLQKLSGSFALPTEKEITAAYLAEAGEGKEDLSQKLSGGFALPTEKETTAAYLAESGEGIGDSPQKLSGSFALPMEKEITVKQEEQRRPDFSREKSVSQVQPWKTSRFASPSARRIARERGIDLDNISGSGPRGRIIKRDVISATESKAPEVERVLTEDTEIPFSRMRKVIAERLTRSKQTIPHFYLSNEVDMTEALAWRKAYNEKNHTRITITDMIIKAVASALSEFERMNAHADSEKIILKKDVNIGVAVAISDGLLVPVIPDANQKDIQEISRVCKENAEAARRGSLRTPATGTFTITNIGMYAISRFFPIINPPECAILGVGSIEKKVVVIDDGIHIRDIMNLCLACDHRAVDGVYAAQFMNRVKEFMENYRILS